MAAAGIAAHLVFTARYCWPSACASAAFCSAALLFADASCPFEADPFIALQTLAFPSAIPAFAYLKSCPFAIVVCMFISPALDIIGWLTAWNGW